MAHPKSENIGNFWATAREQPLDSDMLGCRRGISGADGSLR
jgi:hypothetical protein